MSRERSDTGSLASHSGSVNVEAARLWGSQGSGTGWGWGIGHGVGAQPVPWGPLASSHPWSPAGGHASTARALWGCSRTGAQGWVLWVGSLGASAVT